MCILDGRKGDLEYLLPFASKIQENPNILLSELKQNCKKKPNLLSQVATTTSKMIYPFRHSVAVSKPIVAFLLVFNFCRLHILFCIKDIPRHVRRWGP